MQVIIGLVIFLIAAVNFINGISIYWWLTKQAWGL
jgi:hypothetical protein